MWSNFTRLLTRQPPRPEPIAKNARYSIDQVRTFREAVFLRGWADLAEEGGALTVYVTVNGVRYPAKVNTAEREDLRMAFGDGSERWGFEATALLPTIELADRAAAAIVEIVANSKRVVVERPGARLADLVWRDLTAVADAFFGAVRAARGARVLEIGSRARSGISRRELFDGLNYVGMDVLDGENVDIVGDAHVLSQLVTGKFDFVFSVSVFEHLLMPWKVVVELSKVMNDGGLAYIQTHQTWPVHDAPWDYWRFSRDCWAGLFNKATGFEIVQTAYCEPCNITAAFNYGNPVTNFCDEYGYAGVCVLARKIGPPRVNWDIELSEIVDTTYPV